MFKEEELTYGVDVEIVENENGTWFLAYSQAEGFQPLTYAIKTDSEDDAHDIWCEQPRNADADTEQLVVARLERA